MQRRRFLQTSVAALTATGVTSALHATASTHHTVAIKSFKFSPDILSVRVGDTVTWLNKVSVVR